MRVEVQMSESLPAVLGARALVGVLLRAQGNQRAIAAGDLDALPRLVEDAADALLLKAAVAGLPADDQTATLTLPEMLADPPDEVYDAACEILHEVCRDWMEWDAARDYPNCRVSPSPDRLPLLPIRDWVSFPNVPCIYRVRPATHGRMRAVRRLPDNQRLVFVVTQMDDTPDPNPDRLYPVGCVSYVWETARLSNDSRKVLVQPLYRAALFDAQWDTADPGMLVGRLRPLHEPAEDDADAGLLLRMAHAVGQRWAAPWALDPLRGITSPGAAADLLAAYLPTAPAQRWPLLAEVHPRERLQAVLRAVQSYAA